MKKKLFALLIALAAIATASVQAGNVSVEQARKAAACYMRGQLGLPGLTADDMSLAYQMMNQKLEIPSVYFFNVGNDEGWIAIAATTLADPIITYAEEGSFDIEVAPDNMMYMIECVAKLIDAVQIEHGDLEGVYFGEWERLIDEKDMMATKGNIHRLMTTEWSQGDVSNPTYNAMCPIEGNGNKRVVVGCVATAMSQIMHYFKYPEQPTGFVQTWFQPRSTQLRMNLDTVSFNFSLMPDQLTSSSSQTQIREVAELCYAAGLSVRMSYDTSGSGAHSEDVPAAMNENFLYTLGSLISRADLGDTRFVDSVRAQLMLERPLYMSGASLTGGRDAAGHAWVCCGYQENNTELYWMNWGWGRIRDYYSSSRNYANTWYNLNYNAMNVLDYNFTERQKVIINMYPKNREGIDEATAATGVGQAYPNPATHKVTIPYRSAEESLLTVYGIDGKRVCEQRVEAGTGEATLDVSAWHNGVYIYRVNGASGKFIVR